MSTLTKHSQRIARLSLSHHTESKTIQRGVVLRKHCLFWNTMTQEGNWRHSCISSSIVRQEWWLLISCLPLFQLGGGLNICPDTGWHIPVALLLVVPQDSLIRLPLDGGFPHQAGLHQRLVLWTAQAREDNLYLTHHENL